MTEDQCQASYIRNVKYAWVVNLRAEAKHSMRWESSSFPSDQKEDRPWFMELFVLEFKGTRYVTMYVKQGKKSNRNCERLVNGKCQITISNETTTLIPVTCEIKKGHTFFFVRLLKYKALKKLQTSETTNINIVCEITESWTNDEDKLVQVANEVQPTTKGVNVDIQTSNDVQPTINDKQVDIEKPEETQPTTIDKKPNEPKTTIKGDIVDMEKPDKTQPTTIGEEVDIENPNEAETTTKGDIVDIQNLNEAQPTTNVENVAIIKPNEAKTKPNSESVATKSPKEKKMVSKQSQVDFEEICLQLASETTEGSSSVNKAAVTTECVNATSESSKKTQVSKGIQVDLYNINSQVIGLNQHSVTPSEDGNMF